MKELTARGFDVYTVPEVPTLLMNSGFPYPGMEPGQRELLFDFELQLFKMQLIFEDTVLHMAEQRDEKQTRRPSVIFFDRGLMDIKAYISNDIWEAILARKEVGSLTVEDVMARYDLVIHLVTAADGAEAFYTTANNATRTETPEKAKENDKRVQMAWEGHNNWKRVANAGKTFKEKVNEATKHVVDLVRGS